jgi:hypothetical protein
MITTFCQKSLICPGLLVLYEKSLSQVMSIELDKILKTSMEDIL